MAYARSRAAIYMRRPIGAAISAVETTLLDAGQIPIDRRLTEPERALVGEEIARALTDKAPTSETIRRLREALHGTGLTNELERVVVTELAFARGWGGYVALKGRSPGEDPQVYKITNPGACEDCRRIWGPAGNPVLYRLSAVEAFTAAGGNFGRPRTAWGPTIGPTHPRCTCPPLQRWDPAVHDAVQDVARELAAIYGSR